MSATGREAPARFARGHRGTGVLVAQLINNALGNVVSFFFGLVNIWQSMNHRDFSGSPNGI